MLATHLHTRVSHSILVRLLAIAAFTALTALGARITIDLQPVPITLQVLAVLLAGLTLGARDGAASQVLYAALLTAGLPLAAWAPWPGGARRPVTGSASCWAHSWRVGGPMPAAAG